MAFYDATIPADTEGVKLGASRIREIKSTLNPLIAQLFTDGGAFLSGWVTSTMISVSTLVDSARAITAYAIQTGAVTLRALATPFLFKANALGQSFFEDQIWPTSKLSADITLVTNASFTQPAVGSSVTVGVTTDPIAAGIKTGGPSGILLTASATFVQPAVNSTVSVSLTADPVAAGVVKGMRVKTIDGSFINEYIVSSVSTGPNQVTLQLVSLNGPSIATTVIASGTLLYTTSRTVTFVDGSGVDTYVITDASNSPNQVTLTLVSIGGTLTAGSTVPTAQTLTSLGAVLSADVAGRARMGKGFFTADAAGRSYFASTFFDSSLITFAGEPADGYVKGRLVIDTGNAIRMIPVSTSVDGANNAFIVTGHGLTDATSLATVQPVNFWNATTPNSTSLDGITLGPLNSSNVYWARVFSSAEVKLYNTAADAWAQTNVITPSTMPSNVVMGIVPVALARTGIFANAGVVPLSSNNGQNGGAGAALAGGYRVYWGSAAPADYQTIVLQALAGFTLSAAAVTSGRFSATGTINPPIYNKTSTYFDLFFGAAVQGGGVGETVTSTVKFTGARTGTNIQVFAV